MQFIMLSAIIFAATSCFYYRKYRAERKKHLRIRAKLRRQIQDRDNQLYSQPAIALRTPLGGNYINRQLICTARQP